MDIKKKEKKSFTDFATNIAPVLFNFCGKWYPAWCQVVQPLFLHGVGGLRHYVVQGRAPILYNFCTVHNSFFNILSASRWYWHPTYLDFFWGISTPCISIDVLPNLSIFKLHIWYFSKYSNLSFSCLQHFAFPWKFKCTS